MKITNSLFAFASAAITIVAIDTKAWAALGAAVFFLIAAICVTIENTQKK